MGIPFEQIIAYWHDGSFDFCEGLLGNGSPNRYARRAILKRQFDGHRFILEGVVPALAPKRARQADILSHLSAHGVDKIVLWQKAKNGSWGVFHSGLYWQCRDYIDAPELPRETYANDSWRGLEAAHWLSAIQTLPVTGEVFTITSYIQHLMTVIQGNMPSLYKDLADVLRALDFSEEDERQLPIVFAHGDFHPGNILWGDKTITAVIDWEFSGLKPICYDAANLLGCIGMDNPDWLAGPMARTFLENLELPSIARKYLLQYIVALRFAWMREWWHAKDKVMMIQELDFMWFLLNNTNY